jgi:hypothetical protein
MGKVEEVPEEGLASGSLRRKTINLVLELPADRRVDKSTEQA